MAKQYRIEAIEEKVETLLRKMDLNDKLGQLNLISLQYHLGIQMGMEYTADTLSEKAKELFSCGKVGSAYGLLVMQDEKQVRLLNMLQRFAVEDSPLGIPLMFFCESLRGIVAPTATIFPIPIHTASSWNRSLVYEVHKAIAAEVRSHGFHMSFSPDLDLATDPRWGRMQESYGEDPFLGGELGVAAVCGYQGEEPVADDQHIGAVAKHFAGYGQSEGGRNFAPSSLGRRELMDRITYPFRRAVKDAGMMGIMPGHNEIDGVPSHGNAWLLQEQLRGEWGFDGVVVSDMEDVFRLYHFHHVAKDSSEAAAIALENGISLDLCIQNRAYNALGEAFFERHPHLLKKLDDAVRNVLRIKYRLNLFENPYTKEDPAVFQIQKSQHMQTAKQSAAQGNILLKNDGILPLDAGKIKKLAVIGPNAFPVQCGAYGRNSGISFYEGLRDSLPEAEVRLARGCNITNADAMEFSQASALLKAGNSQKQKDVGLWQEDVVAAAKNLQIASVDPKLISDDENSQLIGEAVEAAVWADAVVLCVGGNNYTARESFYIPDKHLGDRDDLSLPGSQSLLTQKVCAVGKPVVLVLNHGRSNLVEKEINLCQAAVETWFAGEYSGEALARQLLGYDNFSGKLTVTIPRRTGQLPVVYNAKPSSHLKGYLFSDNRVLYPFGYGLSYSSYTYSDLKLSCESMPPDGVCTASVTVKNTSNRDGEEIVQMYIRDEVSSVARPVKELRGFEKVFIPAGEERTVSFTISKELLEFTDVNYHRTVEPGLFEIMIGQNSEETLKAKLLVTEKAS